MKKQMYTKKSFLRRKLYPALAMLLISSIMMVSTSYAWYVLSSAPEVSNIKTQVGANGSLEMALLNLDSWNDLTLLDRGDIDESATASNVTNNLTWGNLINLGDTSYGMDQIVLNPARLYLEENGSGDGGAQYKVNSTVLKTPIYGEDGRIMGLDRTAAVAYVCSGGQFSAEGYGVRAIGTAASMSAFQLGLNSARSSLVTYTAAARTAASNALNQNGDKLANIVVQYALNNKADGYTAADVESIRALAAGLQSALGQIETALRQAFAGYITSAGSGVTAEAYPAALAEVNDPAVTLSTLLTTYSGISTLIPSVGTYITTLTEKEATVAGAIANCDTKISAGGTFTWAEISAIVNPLVDTDQMTVGGKGITELKSSVKNEDGSINFGAVFDLVQGGITIAVPTGSGLLSDIADYAGNYTCKVTVRDFSYGEYGPMDVTANMKTETTANPVYLVDCGNALKGITVSESGGSTAITDFYGYALDLAFRTNAETSHLLLQTEPENRVYEGDNQNAALQGAGSYMSFTTGAGLSATKMVKLMSGVRVAFMDESQNVLAVGALDCTLGKDAYTELSTEEKTATGKWAYLSGGAGSYQKSDLVDYAAYDALPDTSEVAFDSAVGKVTAKLYLYGFSMAKNASGNNTGGMTLEDMDDTAVITALEQDTVKCVTAVVYLDGSVVNNSMVAANSAQSMSGVLNLQFASDADLVPAENTKLRTGSATDAASGTNAGA